MNTINQIEVKYLRPSRTIEKLEISKDLKRSICFVYNHEGNHFRLFDNEMALNLFLKQGSEPKITFDSEEELDKFLLYQYSSF
ncbi:hypothetical protein FHG64_08390 [Antarcticibacterium flavum]|uniref:Uncharacterized protein n=1 Tax=Antarcticibacterium flavum TaxID=2058175 RepID=A0A5B7X249_9FLAO|nr:MULTISPECIES: hypothetical protein [Antarcticibacterium]MCM4161329.1 hypothetical protein [Antarcticibacterium sp. W02-3]QCY69409.1 hypothetical protein FHG64_08390 [Antarcticibacterium flavum]